MWHVIQLRRAMSDFRPALPKESSFVNRGDKWIVINPELPRWIVTDEVGRLLLKLFDGQHTVEDIVDIAVEGIGEEVRAKAERFCRHVCESGLLDCGHARPKQHMMLLGSVHLSLSDGCNLNCVYCYARERQERKFPRLTLKEYKTVIDDVVGINPDVTFTLTGGEPLLNKDCLAIADYIKARGAQAFLLTNGTLITEKNIGGIARSFDLVTLSVDGPDAQVHSMTRGDNFQKVINATKLLEKHGVDYTLSMTVTKKNIAYVEQTAALFGSRLNFSPYFPISGEESVLAITGAEYYAALKSAAGVNPLSYCERTLDSALGIRSHKCAIGDGEFSISATGDVYPCQLLHTGDFYAGNTHERSIREIYYQSPIMQRCARLDVVSIKGCDVCPIRFICGGSCRARAYYEGGDIESSSDFCQYELEAFYDGIISIYSENLLQPPTGEPV